MPTNLDSRPRLDSAFICFSMPSFWSKNHQPLPNCIFPGTEPSWKLPIIVAYSSLSRGLML